jgi:hypothetical protein
MMTNLSKVDGLEIKLPYMHDLGFNAFAQKH